MRITIDDFLKIDHPAREAEYRLNYPDKKLLGIKTLNPRHHNYVEVYGPQQALLAALIKRCLDRDLCERAYKLLRTVDAEPKNRPGIIGADAKQVELRSDGSLSDRQGQVTPAVLQAYGGKADMLGHYYRPVVPRPGTPKCGPTQWTLRKPDLYGGVLEFVQAVNDVYKFHLPDQYARQMKYVDNVEPEFKIQGTAFTTLYVLKNAPTATHTDTFDYKDAFGCMVTLGDFEGSEICFPTYRIAIDYRPGDVLLADVHQLHGNFPLLSGERVACVLFVRKNIHKCPV